MTSMRDDDVSLDYEVSYVDADDYWSSKRRIVLIVEDHQIVREGMRKVVAEVLPCVTLELLEASTFSEARRIAVERRVDIDLILLDVTLPDAVGFDEVCCLKQEWTGMPVVVVSACDDWDLAVDFLRAGALGFIPKSCNVRMMINALRLILAGGRYFPPEVLARISEPMVVEAQASDETLISGKPRDGVYSHLDSAGLSPRQKEVLRLMAQGRSNKEIARELNVSVGTAKNYVAAILRAFNASSRAKAVLAATGAMA